MAEVYNSVSMQQVNDAITAALALLPTAFINGGAPTTVATLLSTWPASATYLGKYARVSDLWNGNGQGGVDEVLRCSYDGASYYWRPQRTDYSISQSVTGGALNLVPLVTPPTLYLTGTLLGGATVTPSATNAWPRCSFNVISQGVLGIFGINVTGLIGGTLPLVAGGIRQMTYTAAGWRGA